MAPLVEFIISVAVVIACGRRLCFYHDRCERVAASAGGLRDASSFAMSTKYLSAAAFEVVTVQIARGKGIGVFKCLLLPTFRLEAR